MNSLLMFVGAVILFIIVAHMLGPLEGFRGRGGRGRGGRGRGGWGRRGFNPNRYVRRFRRGGGWYPRRSYYWGDAFLWPTSWFGGGYCKKGCTPDGCPFPGNRYDECVWASDCYGCYW